MNAALLTIAAWLVTVSCVTTRSPSKIVKRQGSVCLKAADYDETVADFRRYSWHIGWLVITPDVIERFLGKKLADDDRIIRFEIQRFGEHLLVVFVKVVEKKSNKSHFVRLNFVQKSLSYKPDAINEKEFEKWRTACFDLSASKRSVKGREIYPKPPYCSKDFEKSETMAEFRNFAMAPDEVERFLGKKLVDNDTIKRYEIYYVYPHWFEADFLRLRYKLLKDWTAMFLKVTEMDTLAASVKSFAAQTNERAGHVRLLASNEPIINLT